MGGLQAVVGAGRRSPGGGSGIAEQDVDGLVEQLPVGGREVAAALDLSEAEGVELADDRFGNSLADAVFVGFLDADAVLDRVAGEGSGEGVQLSGAAAVVDQLEEAANKRAAL